MKLTLGLLGAAGIAAGIVLLACATDAAQGSPEPGEASTLPAVDGAPEAVAPCDACSLEAGRARLTPVTLPIDQRFNLFGIWGSAANDVWAVGATGLIVHFDGSAWQSTPSDDDQALYTVWGSSANDVWAATSSTLIVHRAPNGVEPPRWKREPVVDPSNWRVYALWGASADELYAVGGYPDSLGALNIVRRRTLVDGGAAWDAIRACDYCGLAAGIWGSGPDDIWLVGYQGQAVHTNAPDAGSSAWQPVQTQTRSNMAALWGSAPNDVWAVGAAGILRHWTNDVGSPQPKWASVDSPTTEDLYAVWGSGPQDVWATGNHGTVIHYDGTSWATLRATGLASPLDVAPLYGIWGSSADDVWIVGYGVVLHAGKEPGQ